MRRLVQCVAGLLALLFAAMGAGSCGAWEFGAGSVAALAAARPPEYLGTPGEGYRVPIPVTLHVLGPTTPPGIAPEATFPGVGADAATPAPSGPVGVPSPTDAPPTCAAPSATPPAVPSPTVALPTAALPPTAAPSPTVALPTVALTSAGATGGAAPTVAPPTVALPTVALPTVALPTAVRVTPPTHTSAGGPIVYLTFDDGPYDKFTPQVLEILARYEASATFFMLGQSVERFPALARSVADAGHSVQNHTYGHVGLQDVGHDPFVADLTRAQVALHEATGSVPFCVRPARGAADTATREAIAELGLQIALWDVDPQDWRRPGSTVIVARVLADVRPGAIVILHDGGGDRSETVAALEEILAELTARGYVFHALAP